MMLGGLDSGVSPLIIYSDMVVRSGLTVVQRKQYQPVSICDPSADINPMGEGILD